MLHHVIHNHVFPGFGSGLKPAPACPEAYIEGSVSFLQVYQHRNRKKDRFPSFPHGPPASQGRLGKTRQFRPLDHGTFRGSQRATGGTPPALIKSRDLLSRLEDCTHFDNSRANLS